MSETSSNANDNRILSGRIRPCGWNPGMVVRSRSVGGLVIHLLSLRSHVPISTELITFSFDHSYGICQNQNGSSCLCSSPLYLRQPGRPWNFCPTPSETVAIQRKVGRCWQPRVFHSQIGQYGSNAFRAQKFAYCVS